MKTLALSLAAAAAAFAQPPFPVTIQVDTAKTTGEFRPAWAFFGYDEPNYTYMKDGKKLLTQLSELSPVPVYVRAHNLLTSGDGQAALKWGSTNAYTEDAQGRPVYDWTIVDRIFDTYVERKMKPLAQIGFMPEALTTGPAPYRHSFSLEKPYSSVFTGWAYPPKDYSKWAELVYQWVRHSVQRYGRAEVESWWWEVWNEPNIGYWKGTPAEYHKLYDFAADAVKRALPTARIGGPHSTGPRDAKAREFLRAFLEHCLRGTNYATGKTGSPLDYVGFHAKGRPVFADRFVRMGMKEQLADVEEGFQLVASFPELKDKPVIIGECDPEGCAACSSRVYKHNGYRNGTMYSSYTADSFGRIYDLASRHSVNLTGIVTWAFEFEDQPWFDGFRDLATNGVEKPVLNVFRMFGRMGRTRIGAETSEQSVRAFATKSDRKISILISHYRDEDLPGPDAAVTVKLDNLPAAARKAKVRHFRIDLDHSNSYEAWKRMGSPAAPSDAQYKQLEKSAKLAEIPPGKDPYTFSLPRQGVSLIELRW